MTYDDFVAHLIAEAQRLRGNECLVGQADPKAWLDALMAVIAVGRGPLAGMARDFIAEDPKVYKTRRYGKIGAGL